MRSRLLSARASMKEDQLRHAPPLSRHGERLRRRMQCSDLAVHLTTPAQCSVNTAESGLIGFDWNEMSRRFVLRRTNCPRIHVRTCPTLAVKRFIREIRGSSHPRNSNIAFLG